MCGLLFSSWKTQIPENFEHSFLKALMLMEYRGKNQSGFYRFQNSFFGHVRLSIIDQSPSSQQPVFDDNHVLLFNGEILNHKEFRKNSHSDTLTLFGLLQKEKISSHDLKGFYSFLFFEKKTNNFKIYRDYFGEKPIYYFSNTDIFIASSTIKPILSILKSTYNATPPLNQPSVKEYFLFGNIKEPETIFEEIKTLPPANVLNYTGNEFRIEKINYPKTKFKEENWDSFIKKAFLEADVKPNLLLSSGVDSTYILAKAASFNIHPNVFIYKNEIDKNRDESEKAVRNLKKIAPQVPFKIIKNVYSTKELYQVFGNVIEQPSDDGLDILNLLSGIKKHSPSTKLVLSGIGGDEIFGGYPTFWNFNKYLRLRKWKPFKYFFPTHLKRFLLAPRCCLIDEVLSYYFKYRMDFSIAQMMAPNELEASFLSYKKKTTLESTEDSSIPFQIKQLETSDYLKNQLLRDTDNISMYLGIEVRNPFLFQPLMRLSPNRKSTMKQYLNEKYNIHFSKKKGFTLGESEENLRNFFLSNIEMEKVNQLEGIPFPEKIETLSTKVLRRIYIFNTWYQSIQKIIS